MKMLITLERLGLLGSIFSNFIYLYILTLYSQRYVQIGEEVSPNIILASGARLSVRPSIVSVNANKSRTAWYILIKFCILIHVNIV